MNHPENQTCSNCLSFIEIPTMNRGICCYNPPIRLDPIELAAGAKKAQSAFPSSPLDGWCRKWEAATTTAKTKSP